jgi:hypothetical protein
MRGDSGFCALGCTRRVVLAVVLVLRRKRKRKRAT